MWGGHVTTQINASLLCAYELFSIIHDLCKGVRVWPHEPWRAWGAFLLVDPRVACAACAFYASVTAF